MMKGCAMRADCHQPFHSYLSGQGMITFAFNSLKSLQATKVLLRNHHGRMDRIRLLKLLYIADREMLVQSGMTLTGSRAVAMKYGPVLEDLFRITASGEIESSLWGTEIQRDGHEVVLSSTDAGVGKLTKGELRKLHELSKRYSDFTNEDLIEETHGFAEWAGVFDENHPDSAPAMTWEAALEAQGEYDSAESIESDLRELQAADAALMELSC